MADCSRYHEMISCLMDGELNDTEKRELDEHLCNCEGCRALKEIYMMAFTDEQIDPPGELVSGSMLRIQAAAAKKKQSMRRRVMRYVAVAASFAIIIFSAPNLTNLKNLTNTVSDTDAVTVSDDETPMSGGCAGSYDPTQYLENDYIASVNISGELPELLEDYTQTANGDGSYSIEIRSYMLAYLDSQGYSPTYNQGSESEWALVNYTPKAA